MSSNKLFEEMLSKSQLNSRSTLTVVKASKQQTSTAPHQAIGMLRAESSASFDDFISMVSKLVCLTMDDLEYEVEFVPDDEKDKIIEPDIKIDKIYITYNLISRVPHREIKPMAREEIVELCDVTGEERMGVIYGQKYDCEVQFNIFASEYKMANEVMKVFEEMIFSFTGYMKEKGIANILFKEQFTDTDFNIYRKSLSVRNLRYHIETENLIVQFNDKIQQIIAKGNL